MEIKLQGVYNIRDFSEYGFPGYIRSAHLHGMTDEDAAILRDRYHLRTVIDLRTSTEKEEQPDRVPEGVTYLHIPLFDEAMAGISHEQETQGAGAQLPDMTALYRGIVTDTYCVSQIREVMRTIDHRAGSGAVLWHCTEGKDRCGIISAIFLLSRSIDPSTVMADYLKTNETAVPRAEQYYQMLMRKTGDAAKAEKVRSIFLAKQEYMVPVLELLTTQSAWADLIP